MRLSRTRRLIAMRRGTGLSLILTCMSPATATEASAQAGPAAPAVQTDPSALPAQAVVQGPVTTPPSNTLADPMVGDIVVTAQKRSQSLQDVPISIAVVGGERMRENAILNFQDLAPAIPNFSITKTPAANVIAMRGIESSPGSPSLEQSVVLFVDGIYGGNSRQFNAPFLDVERVEVLRGPQGALVGKNTSAGAINILSRRPTNQFEAYVNADYNISFHGPGVEAGVNLPVGDKLAIRAVGKYSYNDGYLYNTLTGHHDGSSKELIGRLSALYKDGPLSIYAKYEHADNKGNGNPVQVYSVSKGRLLDYTKESLTTLRPEVDNIFTNNAVVQVDYELGGHTLSSITGYSGFKSDQYEDSDFTEVNAAVSEFAQKLNQYSEELRIISPTGKLLEYALGALYQKGDLDEQRTSGILIAPPASTYRSFVQTTRDTSVYGQAALNFTKQLRLQGTLRYTHTTKSAEYRRLMGPTTYIEYNGTLVRDFSDAISENHVDPSGTLQYRPNHNVMLYATYQQGSKSGGFQGAISNAELAAFRIGAEKSQSYEAGAKLSLPGLGYLNLAVFDTLYKNLQVSTPIAGSTGFFTGNAGNARVIGVEVDGLLRAGHGFEFEGNGAWDPKAKYLTYLSGPCALGQVPNGTLAASCVLTGLRLPYTPKLSGALTARYRTDLSQNLRLTTSVTGLYQSTSRKVDANDTSAIQSSWGKLDGRIAISTAGDKWELALIGRNLTNKLTLAYGGAGGLTSTVFASDARNVVVDPPRTVLVSLSAKF